MTLGRLEEAEWQDTLDVMNSVEAMMLCLGGPRRKDESGRSNAVMAESLFSFLRLAVIIYWPLRSLPAIWGFTCLCTNRSFLWALPVYPITRPLGLPASCSLFLFLAFSHSYSILVSFHCPPFCSQWESCHHSPPRDRPVASSPPALPLMVAIPLHSTTHSSRPQPTMFSIEEEKCHAKWVTTRSCILMLAGSSKKSLPTL